jgi:PTS system ascorbate-specific IIA component
MTMSVGILLLTHAGIGDRLVEAATSVLGPLPLKTTCVGYRNGEDRVAFAHAAARAMRELDGGDGVLVLSDLYGSTPSNAAAEIASQGTRVRRVSAVSLPMLLRVMNYPEQGLDDLASTAAAGGRNGIVIDHA